MSGEQDVSSLPTPEHAGLPPGAGRGGWRHRVNWRAGLALVLRLPALLVIGALRGWQFVISPTYGATCRFYPSCSSYAVEAITRHGLIAGGLLAIRRLTRCHPWNPGGVDDVPQNIRWSPRRRSADAPHAQRDGVESGHRAA